jgi:hypothetical protein
MTGADAIFAAVLWLSLMAVVLLWIGGATHD